MGGLSQGGFQINDAGNAVFIGRVSLENNGGFTSVKNQIPLNLTGNRAFLLNIAGDGNRYSFRFKCGQNRDSNNQIYECRFQSSANIWTEITLPFDDFKAVYKGQDVPGAPPPDFSAIREYGFLISDRQEGEFRLEIDWIKVV